jgi:chromosome segregation ATPase
MARATLEMFLKLTGADKTSRGLDNVSNSANNLDNKVKNSTKANAKFSAGMSGLGAAAVAGSAIIAGKALINFSLDALEAAVGAEEAAAAFGTTYGDAAQKAGQFTEQFANKAGLTNSELQQLLSTLGAVAQGIGFTQAESADLGIELTKIAADVASFSNISAGAEPVLKAFQSALTGEREALKTYGIAISEAEVQTKAFEMTGKTNAEALTRQEKAYATLALIQQKAAVQIGDLDRTSESFANQQRAVSAEVRQLKEDIGAELIPAAAEMLPIFREFTEDVAPPLINAFKEGAYFVADMGKAIEYTSIRLEYFSNRMPQTSERLQKFLGLFLKLSPFVQFINHLRDIADEQREFDVRTDNTAESLINASIAQGLYNKSLNVNRQQTLVNTTQTGKYAETIDKKLNPIFGEQNALILSNIQLETNRNTLMKLINSANQDLAIAQTNYNNALKEVNRLTIEENVRDAEAAIRKAELQTQIALLTEAQNNGKDVSLDLALAQAQLAEAEYELANNSDALTAAKSVLTVAEQNLETATKNQQKAIEERNKQLVRSIDLTNQQANANQKIIDQGELYRQFRAIETAPIQPFIPNSVETPANTVANQSAVISGSTGNGGGDTYVEVYIGDEKIDEVVQKSNTRIQEQGKTFAIR